MTTKDEIIEIMTNEGKIIPCELFDMVEHKNKYYALLVEQGHAEDEEPELMIYRYREVGDDVFFEIISDKNEFEEISKYIENLPQLSEE